MAQAFQSLKNGYVNIEEIPMPNINDNEILIETTKTIISAGTERMLAEFGRSNWISKASQQPDKVKQVIAKARTNGIFNTLDTVLAKLDEPLPLGYCNVGNVIKVGRSVSFFKPGDRVVSNGYHSEIVVVPEKLCAKIPKNVKDEEAIFTVLASIGLQGIRLAEPTIGEVFVVSGLGLIGILTAQVLISGGMKVIGIDPDNKKLQLANNFGIKTFLPENIENLYSYLDKETSGNGVDGVIVTATTKSSDPIHLAAEICRKRGRIILVGVTGLNLNRELFYKKEIKFQVSCSYGPGRYDPSYEIESKDYPFGFVRWTEQRNFQAILNLLSDKKLITNSLITHQYNFNKISDAYETLLQNKFCLGIVINYKSRLSARRKIIEINKTQILKIKSDHPNISFIGAGNYSSSVLIPAFKKAKVNFKTIGAQSGKRSFYLGKKYNFNNISTDIDSLIKDKSTDAIVIATRHDSHAELIIKGLNNNKHIFVEKPLCLNLNELEKIKENVNENKLLMVGFNRRFSSLTKILKNELEKINSKTHFIFTCNAGKLTDDHWLLNKVKGGGRLIGEACHFIDLLRYLSNSEIEKIIYFPVDESNQSFYININFNNGSSGCIQYITNGSYSFQKERLDVFVAGKVFQINNFLNIRSWGNSSLKSKKLFKQDKGQEACVKAFIKAIKDGGPPPIPIEEIFEVQAKILSCLNQ